MSRFGCVYALAAASAMFGGASAAFADQSLIDGLSASAARVASTGSWAAKPTHLSQLNPWKASILPAVPTLPRHSPLVAVTATVRPFGLHGPVIEGPEHSLTGVASYYGAGAQLTAAGETFDPTAMTAAHPTLPFGTKVRVTRVDTGDSVVVRINDRGPFKPGRIIDLTQGAAENLGITDAGLAQVRLEVLDR